jgi:hypothetical protein
MKELRGYKITLEEVLNAHPADALNQQFISPVKATILSFNAGTLSQDKAGNYFITVPGEWHRWGNNSLPQVDAFDQLNAMNLTLLKEDLMKELFAPKEEELPAPAPVVEEKEVVSGQEDGKHDSTGDEKVNPPVEANPKRQKKSKNRT